jgi:hypothetical protein
MEGAMTRFIVAPAVKRALVVAIVTGFVAGCSVGDQTAAPSPTSQGQSPQTTATLERTPAPSVWTGLPSGPFVITGTEGPVQVTLNITSPGWKHHSGPDVEYVNKNDDGLDPPESVAATLLAWAFPAGAEFNVFVDSCRSVPGTSATTPDEIAEAFAALAVGDATAPVDNTVGGFAGKAITIHGPMKSELPNASPQRTLGDCEVEFAVGLERDDFGWPFGVAGGIDELAILNVDGSIVILDAVYTQATPADLVEEMRTLGESATFRLP